MNEVERTGLTFKKQKHTFHEEKKRFSDMMQKQDSDHQSVQAKLQKLAEYKERSDKEILDLKEELARSLKDDKKVKEIVEESTKKVRQEHEATVA